MAKADISTLADGTRIDMNGMWAVCEHCIKLKPMRELGMRRMKPGPLGLIQRQPRCKKCRQL